MGIQLVSNNYLVLPMECRNDWHLLKISISCQFCLFIPEFIHPNVLLGLALTCLTKLAFAVIDLNPGMVLSMDASQGVCVCGFDLLVFCPVELHQAGLSVCGLFKRYGFIMSNGTGERSLIF
jgi:hypothetical protein